MRIILISLLLIVLLGGCSWTNGLIVKTEPVERIPLILPEADRYYHRDIKWVIVTPENVDKVFAELAKKGQPLAVIGLSGDGYKNLSLNTADQEQLIKQLKATINAYKEYYIAVEKRDAKINEKAGK